METRIEHEHHRRARHRRLAGPDADDRCGVVQGGEILDLLHEHHRFFRDERGLFEGLSRGDDAMPHRIDFLHRRYDARLFVREFFENELHGDVVVGHGLFDHRLLSLCLMGEFGTLDADPLAIALGDDLLGLHVDELIFEGGAPRIDDQNFHCPASPVSKLRLAAR